MQDSEAFQSMLGKRIRELRSAKGYSQEAFADACGIHRTHISLLERGKLDVKIGTLRKLAVILEMNLAEIFATLD